jgi:hypothetical protein
MECHVMAVSSVGASTNAYAYLQSLLPPEPVDGSQKSTDPVTQLLDAFYPSGTAGPPTTSTADPTQSTTGATTAAPATAPPFSPDTMSTLMSAQEQQPGANGYVAARAANVFGEFDTDGNGQISKTEFEDVFGANADGSKVDGLFNALDANADGSISQDELTSAAQASHAQHHHHHHFHGGRGVGGVLDALLNSGTQGASASTASNSDGSSTTTITYADGSKVSLTSPPGGSDTGSSGTDTGSADQRNLLEQLIRQQAQFLSVSPGQTLTSI